MASILSRPNVLTSDKSLHGQNVVSVTEGFMQYSETCL